MNGTNVPQLKILAPEALRNNDFNFCKDFKIFYVMH